MTDSTDTPQHAYDQPAYLTRAAAFEKLSKNLFTFVRSKTNTPFQEPTIEDLATFLLVYVKGRDLDAVELAYESHLQAFAALSEADRITAKRYVAAMCELLG